MSVCVPVCVPVCVGKCVCSVPVPVCVRRVYVCVLCVCMYMSVLCVYMSVLCVYMSVSCMYMSVLCVCIYVCTKLHMQHTCSAWTASPLSTAKGRTSLPKSFCIAGHSQNATPSSLLHKSS